VCWGNGTERNSNWWHGRWRLYLNAKVLLRDCPLHLKVFAQNVREADLCSTFPCHNTYRILGTIQKPAYRLDASGVYFCACMCQICACCFIVLLHCLGDCGCVLWWDKPNQIVLDFTSCQVPPKCNFLQKSNFLSSHKLTRSKSKRENTNNLFNKDIFQGEMITCGLSSQCVRHRECVWVACLWRIGMNRKSQRMFGQHQTHTEVWNERDRARVKCVCVCLWQRIARGCPSAVTLIMLCRLILLSGGNDVWLDVFECVCVVDGERELYATFAVCLIPNMIISWKDCTNEWYISRRRGNLCFIMQPICYKQIKNK